MASGCEDNVTDIVALSVLTALLTTFLTVTFIAVILYIYTKPKNDPMHLNLIKSDGRVYRNSAVKTKVRVNRRTKSETSLPSCDSKTLHRLERLRNSTPDVFRDTFLRNDDEESHAALKGSSDNSISTQHTPSYHSYQTVYYV